MQKLEPTCLYCACVEIIKNQENSGCPVIEGPLYHDHTHNDDTMITSMITEVVGSTAMEK